MKYLKYYLLALFIIVLDQAVKLLVHYNMDMGLAGQIPVFGDWFKLHYTLNPGMAFGLQLGSEYGKLFLTVFRLFAMVAIGFYLYFLAKKKSSSRFVVVCSFNFRRCHWKRYRQHLLRCSFR